MKKSLVVLLVALVIAPQHVRDDAGHSSSATTDRYIDVELAERAKSARNKPLLKENPRKHKTPL